jgi:hypothetical protein
MTLMAALSFLPFSSFLLLPLSLLVAISLSIFLTISETFTLAFSLSVDPASPVAASYKVKIWFLIG